LLEVPALLVLGSVFVLQLIDGLAVARRRRVERRASRCSSTSAGSVAGVAGRADRPGDRAPAGRRVPPGPLDEFRVG
jgi:hypothetical protein